MSRNVTIVIIILIIVLLAAYLVWLRGRYSAPAELPESPIPVATTQPTPSVEPTPEATATATPSAQEATKGAKTQKNSTSSGKAKD